MGLETAKANPLPDSMEDWQKPKEQAIPRPTYAPAVVAIAIICLFWGLVTTFLISLLGGILFFIGLADWIGELRHEHR